MDGRGLLFREAMKVKTNKTSLKDEKREENRELEN